MSAPALKCSARALDKRDQHVLARLDRGADRGQRPPHRAGDRVAPVGAVEDDPGEWRLEEKGDVGHAGLMRDGWRLEQSPLSNCAAFARESAHAEATRAHPRWSCTPVLRSAREARRCAQRERKTG